MGPQSGVKPLNPAPLPRNHRDMTTRLRKSLNASRPSKRFVLSEHRILTVVSGDDIETLTKFSVQVCQSKFPVASDKTQAIMKSFDAVMQTRPEYANRISYVIAPNGTVVFQYMSLNPTKHVEKTLDALRGWSNSRGKK